MGTGGTGTGWGPKGTWRQPRMCGVHIFLFTRESGCWWSLLRCRRFWEKSAPGWLAVGDKHCPEHQHLALCLGWQLTHFEFPSTATEGKHFSSRSWTNITPETSKGSQSCSSGKMQLVKEWIALVSVASDRKAIRISTTDLVSGSN